MGHGIIWWIIIGLIAGFLTGKLMKGSGYGAIMDIVVGIIGAVVGGFIMSHIFGAASSGGLIYSIIVAVIGAVLLTFLLRLITGGRTSNLSLHESRFVSFRSFLLKQNRPAAEVQILELESRGKRRHRGYCASFFFAELPRGDVMRLPVRDGWRGPCGSGRSCQESNPTQAE